MGSRKSFNPMYHHDKMVKATQKVMKNRDKEKISFSRDFILRVQERCLDNVKDLIWYGRK